MFQIGPDLSTITLSVLCIVFGFWFFLSGRDQLTDNFKIGKPGPFMTKLGGGFIIVGILFGLGGWIFSSPNPNDPLPTPPPKTSTVTPETPTSVSKSEPTITASILFEEDFENEVIDKFFHWDDTENSWQIATDQSGNIVYEINNLDGSRYPRIIFGLDEWKNYEAEYRAKILAAAKPEATVLLYFRSSQSFVTYDLQAQVFFDNFVVGFATGTSWQELASKRFDFELDRWYTIRLQAQGSQIRGFVDNKLIIETEDTRLEEGALGISVGPGAHVQIDDILVKSLDE